jgi:hypothetical protein
MNRPLAKIVILDFEPNGTRVKRDRSIERN